MPFRSHCRGGEIISNTFTYYRCPAEVTSPNYPIIVFDIENSKFKPLTVFYKKILLQYPESTAITYLNCLLPFFTWMYQFSNYKGKLIQWDDKCEAIQEAVHDYLTHKLACKIRDAKGSKLVFLTAETSKTIRVFLAAIKRFYHVMLREEMYKYPNPLLEPRWDILKNHFSADSSSIRPRMPDIAGTEHKRKSYLSDSYFVITGDQWTPAVIDDVRLPSIIFTGGELVGWNLRDKLIARMLFECGARISEIVYLTVGDYRSRIPPQEFYTVNKGSNGKRVKFIRCSNETITLFYRYMNGERKDQDPHGLSFIELPDEAPVFLSERGTPYNYHAWYVHWKAACKAMNIDMNPHKSRHWYVTQALREIYETSQNENDLQRKTNQLIEYIKWKDKDTIQVYQHYFDAKKHREIQDKLFLKMQEQVNEYNSDSTQRLPIQLNKEPSHDIGNEEVDDFLWDFFN